MKTIRRFRRRFYRWLYATPTGAEINAAQWILVSLLFIGIAIFCTWFAAQGWLDGADPFPGVDAVPGF